jgi:hypothetical protein
MDKKLHVDRKNLQHRYLSRAFAQDGALREIRVSTTNVDDWQSILDFLIKGDYEIIFISAAKRTRLPSDVEEIFKLGIKKDPMLIIDLGKIELKCHFRPPGFVNRGIRFDLDPFQVNSEPRAIQVFEFMKEIGEVVRKDVVLTPKNSPHIYYRFNLSSGEIELGSDMYRR